MLLCFICMNFDHAISHYVCFEFRLMQNLDILLPSEAQMLLVMKCQTDKDTTVLKKRQNYIKQSLLHREGINSASTI